MPRPRRSRAIATIIGGVLLAIALLAILALYFYLNTQQKELLNTLSQAAQEKISTQLLASSLQGYYTYNYLTDTLTITITSNAPRAVTITSIDILWDNQTTLVIDRYTELGTTITATLTSASGTTYTVNSFPVTMAPGDTLEVTISQATQPITITATLSASPAVAVITIKQYKQQGQSSTIASLLTHLEHSYYDWTQTWSGEALAQYLKQDYAIANYTQLQEVDNTVIVLSQNQPSWYIKITRAGNLLYYYDFEKGMDDWIVYGTPTYWGISSTAYGYSLYYNTINNDTNGVGGDSIAYYRYGDFLRTYPQLYVLGYLSPITSTGDTELSFFDGVGNYLLTLSIEPPSRQFIVYIYDNGWNILYTSNTIRFRTGSWYVISTYIDTQNSYLLFNLTDTNGNLLDSSIVDLSQYATAISQLYYPGFSAYEEEGYYDFFIVSRQNPNYLIFKFTINGILNFNGTLILYDQSGNQLFSVPIINGQAVVRLFTDYNEPVVYNVGTMEVLDTTGAIVFTYDVGTEYPEFVFGETYYINAQYIYVVDLTDSTQINTALNVYDFLVRLYFVANSSGTWELYLWNYINNSWDKVNDGTFSSGIIVDKSTGYYLYANSPYVDPTTGNIIIRVIFVSQSPFEASVDMLNAVYRYLVSGSTYALLVGMGGSKGIDFYLVNDTNILYQYSKPSSTIFDGSAAFTYDWITNYIYLINETGIYKAPITPLNDWMLLTDTCHSLGQNAAIGVIIYNNEPIIVVIEGGDSDIFCAINANIGNIVMEGSISSYVGDTITLSSKYVTTSWTISNDTFYVIAYDKNRSAPVLLKYNIGNGWSIVTYLPEAFSAGMSFDGTYLWIINQRDSLYQVDPINGAITYINGSLGFVPWGPGNRLNYINNLGLVFLRADGTNEVYLISPS